MGRRRQAMLNATCTNGFDVTCNSHIISQQARCGCYVANHRRATVMTPNDLLVVILFLIGVLFLH